MRRGLHTVFLGVGMLLLFGLLVRDLRAMLAPSALPALGDAVAARMRPLTQGASMDGFGVWSPDGRQIAFMRDGQILLTDPGGRESRVLSSEPEHWDADPAWRPDGTALAVVRLSMRGDQSRVMLLDPAGKAPPLEVARDPGTIGYVAWSPDGQALYYTTADRIVRVDLASGRTEPVFRAPPGWQLISGGLAVTKDGDALIFGGGPRRAERTEYDLWLLPLKRDAQPERLTTSGGIMPSLDPTGQWVAYRNPRQETGIYRLSLATRKGELLVADEPGAMYFHPSISRDGRMLLVSRLLLASLPDRGRRGFTSNLYLVPLSQP